MAGNGRTRQGGDINGVGIPTERPDLDEKREESVPPAEIPEDRAGDKPQGAPRRRG